MSKKDKNKPKDQYPTKRYSLSADEKTKLQNIQSVIGILAIQKEGLNHSIMLELARARARLNIKDADAPPGFDRHVDFDEATYELIVVDLPKKKPEEIVQDAMKEAGVEVEKKDVEVETPTVN